MSKLVFALIFLLAWCWGPSYFCIKVALADLSPLMIAWTRVGIGMCIVLVALFWSGQRLPRLGLHWWRFFVTGLLAAALPFTCFGLGERSISSALAAVINGTVPIITCVLAHLFIPDERLNRQRVLGVGLGVLGFATLLFPTLAEGSIDADATGILLVGTACFCYGSSMVFSRRFLRGVSPMVTAASQLVCAFIVLTPLLFVLQPPWELDLPSRTTVLAMGYLSFIGTGAAFLLFFNILDRAGATVLSMVTYLMPIIGACLGVFAGGERLSPWALLGFAFILTGMVCVNLRRRAAKPVLVPAIQR